MQKSKLFIGLSAALLTIGGFAATKVRANHKLTSANAYYKTAGGLFHTIFTNAAFSNLTTIGSAHLAKITTAGGTQKTMFATAATTKPLYLK